MLQWALRQHPGLWGGPESDYLVSLVSSLRQTHALGSSRGQFHWLSGLDVSQAEFVKHVGHGINSLYSDRSGGLRWVEQTPGYAKHLGDIALLFPNAIFLVLIRDGRQVVHSLRHFVNPVEHDDACCTWRDYTNAALEFARTAGTDRTHTLRYEDVVANTEAALKKLYSFLGETFEPKSVELIRSKAPINSSFTAEASNDKLSPRWPAWTLAERERFDEIAGGLLISLGYESDSAWVSA